jgi:hypothetical protein
VGALPPPRSLRRYEPDQVPRVFSMGNAYPMPLAAYEGYTYGLRTQASPSPYREPLPRDIFVPVVRADTTQVTERPYIRGIPVPENAVVSRWRTASSSLRAGGSASPLEVEYRLPYSAIEPSRPTLPAEGSNDPHTGPFRVRRSLHAQRL